MVFEQYDENDELVERVVVDKNTERATSYTEESGLKSIRLEGTENKEEVSKFRSNSDDDYVYKKIDTVKAYNILNPATKTMDVYEGTKNSDIRDYSIPKASTTVARFVAQVALALELPADLSGNLVGAMIAAGICKAVDDLIVFVLDVKVECIATYYNYYGKDTATGKKSTTMRGGTKYKVTDSGKYLNKTYIEGDVYNDKSATYRIAKLLVQNIYGVDFDVQV